LLSNFLIIISNINNNNLTTNPPREPGGVVPDRGTSQLSKTKILKNKFLQLKIFNVT